jgi:N4-acetylcytidine amidohydrolase
MENHKEEALPPKTCTVDKLITAQPSVDMVLSGQKTATRRNGRYADVGEIMTLQGHQFVIERVYLQTIGDLTEADAAKEGYGTLEDYKQSILSFHPGMPWLPQMKMWVHEFRPVGQ